jgi:hypothetical protein
MEKSWREMTAAEKKQVRYRKWLSPEGVQFRSAEAEEKYKRTSLIRWERAGAMLWVLAQRWMRANPTLFMR